MKEEDSESLDTSHFSLLNSYFSLLNSSTGQNASQLKALDGYHE